METSGATTSRVSRVWFVTGASRGLGRAFTEAALAAGDRVVGAARDVAPLDDLAAQYPDRLLVLSLDVTDRAAVFDVVDRAVAHFGRLDIVVNNAGALFAGMVEEFTEAQARAQLDLNFFGALWVSQAVLPQLRAQGSGHIVQISSIGALGGFPSTGLYSASKFALEGMSEALAAEAAEAAGFGVKVTIVQPGGYWTDLYTSSTATTQNPVYDALREELAKQWAEGSVDSEPRLAAEAVMTLVDSDDPPQRLLLGSMVYDLAFDISRQRMDTWAGWEQVSRAAEKAVPALTIRPIAGRDELDLFSRLSYVFNEELADDLAAGRRRPEWMWVAMRGDHLLARVAWWGQTGDDTPSVLDIFDLDDSTDDLGDVGVRLLRTATADVVPTGTRPPEYYRLVPPDWREDRVTRRVVEDRMNALERTGARLSVERLRFQWHPGTPIPEPSGRLVFRPVRDTEEILTMMTQVLAGTLDAHSRDDLTRMAARDAAVRHYEEELARYRSPRDWWRIATLPNGEPVGFVTPARNDYNPIIGYLAVLPEHRGNGYIDEILAEGTRVLNAQDVPRIRATTDLGNTPMANAFQRAGYVNFERSINMTWPDPASPVSERTTA